PSRLSGFLSSAAWPCAALPHPVADPTITPPSTRSRKSFLNSMVPPWKDTETTRVGWERHPPSVGSAAHEVAGRLVIADPEVPRRKLRSEGRVGLASPARAADPLRVAPDHLRVMATLLPGGAAIARVVVILRLARPGGGCVREGPPVCRGAGRDVLATVAASRVVLVHAAVRPRLRHGGGFRRPAERENRPPARPTAVRAVRRTAGQAGDGVRLRRGGRRWGCRCWRS